MTGREPRTVRVDPEKWSAFVEQVIEWEGQKSGELGRHVENALSEYVDNDRLARVERKLDALLEDSNATHTHTPRDTSVKLNRIADRINGGDRVVIPDDAIVRAIEDIAGVDDRTVKKYRQQLKRRGLAWEHPTGGTWTLDRGQWVKWTRNHADNNPAVDLLDVLDPYPMDFDQFNREATEIEQ